MRRMLLLSALAGAALSLAPLGAAQAFTTPFHFHCSGNACRVVAFGDEGNGCTVTQNRSGRAVHVTQGPFSYDLGPGEVHAELNGTKCAGYYDGGETAAFE